MNIKDQTVHILGGGRSGFAAARLAVSKGADVTILDTVDGERATQIAERVSAELPTVKVFTGEAAENFDQAADLLVVSPGIPLESGWGQKITSKASQVIGEIEFGYRFIPKHVKIVGITGTNGKTTTTAMIASMARENGISAIEAGNFGLPLCDVVLDYPEVQLVALELSSFQLETIVTFRPDIAVWLNFAADHLDRYASMEEYRLAKERIFENLSGDDPVVAPYSEINELPLLDLRTISFSVSPGMAKEADIAVSTDGVLTIRGREADSVDHWSVRGRHNYANAAAALGACLQLDLDEKLCLAALRHFKGQPHRFEVVDTVRGVTFINDSKSTNLHSLAAALHAEVDKVVLIAGGKDKGLNFSSLAPLIQNRTSAVVVFGENRQKLATWWADRVKLTVASDLREAVEKAAELAAPNGIVLFSPGTSSYDLFDNYEHRGECFREEVARLGGRINASH